MWAIYSNNNNNHLEKKVLVKTTNNGGLKKEFKLVFMWISHLGTPTHDKEI